jgi:dihydrodipicolinate synthase/N-acetylneuraminate lyase
MEYRKLYGVVCASVCPMNSDGTLDKVGVRRLTRYLVDNGIHGLYPNGTNGESLSLTRDERREIIEIVKDENAGKAVLYNQCGAGTVAESYDHVRFSQNLGIDGAGLMTPVFFQMDDAAMYDYYNGILSEVAEIPVYAYNIPTRSGNDLKPDVLGRLMEQHGNLKGIKYSYSDLVRIQQYLTCVSSRQPSVLVGSDAMAMACVLSGGDGWVSGPSAVYPKYHVELYQALKEGDITRAKEMQYAIIKIARSMSDIPEIPAIKYMLFKMGIISSDYCRPPLRRLSDSEKCRLDKLLSEL